MISRKVLIAFVITVLVIIGGIYLFFSYLGKASLKSEISEVKIGWTDRLGFVQLLHKVYLFSEGVRILNNNVLVRTKVNRLTIVLTDKPQTALILKKEDGAPSISFSWIVDDKGHLYLFSYVSSSILSRDDAGTVLVKFVGGALQTIQKDELYQDGKLVMDNKNYSDLFSDQNFINITR